MHRPMRYPLCLAVIIISAFLKLSTADEAKNFCFWTKITSNGETHHSFLRHNKKNHHSSPSHHLYHSVWSGERKLVNCAWNDDTAVTENYLSLCQKTMGDFSETPDKHFDIRTMLGPDSPCVAISSPMGTKREERTGSRHTRSIDDTVNLLSQHPSVGGDSPGMMRHRRVKRGFIVPGTLWCGSGNKAPTYSDLGVFTQTDSCCREHDQCKDTILSFQSSYGVFNTNIFTMSHCDCDNRFRRCLLNAQDSISDVVGYTFFNLLKLHCFEFSHRLQCAQRNWFGICQVSEMSLYAVVHPPTLYNSTHPDYNEDNMTATTTTISTTITTPAELTTGSQETSMLVTVASSTSGPSTGISAPASPAVSSSASAASPTLTPGADTSTSEMSTQETETASMSVSSKVGENTLPTQKPRTTSSAKPTLSNALPLPEQNTTNTGKQQMCEVYRDLDVCRFKILPQQKRYGLQNPEPRVLYHCNCTSRLFQGLCQQKELSGVQSVLLEYVSQSCFSLPQDCIEGTSCTAGLIKAPLPQLVQKKNSNDMEERRHLEASRLNVRRPNYGKAKRMDRPVRLHKLCLRMTQPKVHKTRTLRLHGSRTRHP